MLNPVFSLLAAVMGLPVVTGLAGLAFTHRRYRPLWARGLVVHTFRKRTPWDCSYVRSDNLYEGIDMLTQAGIQLTTVRDFATSSSSAWNKDTACTTQRMLVFDDGYEEACTAALPRLAERGILATFYPIVTAIGRRCCMNDVFGNCTFASVSLLRDLVAAGHEIGNHTLTHPALPFLGDSDLQRELGDSRRRLEDLLSTSVTSLSFPYGSWNERVWDVAQEAGHTQATVYGETHIGPSATLFPVAGVYAFDTPGDICAKLTHSCRTPHALLRAAIMARCARGTALWRFRPNYSVRPPTG